MADRRVFVRRHTRESQKRKDYLAEHHKTYYKMHKEELNAYDVEYRKAHYEEIREREIAYNEANRDRKAIQRIVSTYHISERDAETLFALREGEGVWCDICRTTEGQIDIDHDHQTGKIRGILCRKCNIRLATLEDPEFQQAATIYLEAEP